MRLILAVTLIGACWAQAVRPVPGPVSASRVSNAARRYLTALGDRAIKPGQERSVNAGTIQLAIGAAETIAWTWEFPGKLRLDRQGRKDVVVFDPAESRAVALAEIDDEILEVLSDDTAETFFDRMQGGVSPRMLGTSFKAAGPAGFGREVDIFEVAGPVAARTQKGAAVKHFHFDSATGFLARVVYDKRAGGRVVTVRTEYSKYEALGGQRVARTIARYQGSQKVFEITVLTSAFQAGAKDGQFTAR